MDALDRQTPAGRPASGGGLQASKGRRLHINSTLREASVKVVDREISIVLAAADTMARGHQLSWSDYDRLHSAHQVLIRFLAALRGQEVTT